MKLLNTIILVSTVALAVGGCAPTNDSVQTAPLAAPAAPKTASTDLNGLSLVDVLKQKYEKAELKCDLWVQQNQALDLNLLPNDSGILDLKAIAGFPQSAFPIKMNLKSKVRQHESEFQVIVNRIELSIDHRVRDLDGTLYHLKYSPTVNANFTHNLTTHLSGGAFSVEGSGSSVDVFEKIKSVQLNANLPMPKELAGGTLVDFGAYRDYGHCYIDTVIKPEFKDQFKTDARSRSGSVR